MSRPVRFYQLADQRNAMLRHTTLDITGRAANGSQQGRWIVAARTKVRAAEIASELFSGPVRPAALEVVTAATGGADVAQILRARGVLPSEETAVCWRRSYAGDPVVTYTAGQPDAPTVVGHWRSNAADAYTGTRFVPAEIDPELRPTRPVMLPDAVDSGVYVERGVTRTEFPGGAFTYSTGEVFILGLGRMSIADATRHLQSVAAAVTEAERIAAGGDPQ